MVILDERSAGLLPGVSAFAEAIVFQRSRGFASDPLVAADELYHLLETRGTLERAVYVAPSFAAFTGICVAAKHPGALAGLLLLDPSHPRQGEVALSVLEAEPSSPIVKRLRDFFRGFGPVWDQACKDLCKIKNLGYVDLRILAGARYPVLDGLPEKVKERLMSDRLGLLKEYCQLSRCSRLTVIEEAGHDVAADSPEKVIAFIREFTGWISEKSARPGA